MKPKFFTFALLLSGAALIPLHAQNPSVSHTPTTTDSRKGKPITEVAHFDEYQVTGVAVSKSNRLFVNFPRWSNDYKYAVTEVGPDSSTKPFPDEQWNSWKDKDPAVAEKFVSVQSVVIDDTDALWVLDTGNPGMTGTLPGAPKLVKIDLTTNSVVQKIPFGADIAPAKAYLNDVRFDNDKGFAYITESGIGSIIIVDLKSGKSRRVLVEDESTVLNKKVDLTINGKEVMTAEKQRPKFNVDGIALSPDKAYLYYQSIMADTLYRIGTDKLRDESLSKSELSKDVQKVCESFPVDGLWMDKEGFLYMSDLRDGAIQRRTPEGKIELVCADPRIQWPDSFAQGPDGAVYFTCSHIHHSPQYNGGKSARTEPYTVFKVMP